MQASVSVLDRTSVRKKSHGGGQFVVHDESFMTVRVEASGRIAHGRLLAARSLKLCHPTLYLLDAIFCKSFVPISIVLLPIELIKLSKPPILIVQFYRF